MNITVTDSEKSTNIVVDGNIEVLNFKNFKNRLAVIAENSGKDLVIDLVNMDYISSTTIGDLINLRKKLAKNGRKLAFGNISAGIIRSLTFCRLIDTAQQVRV